MGIFSSFFSMKRELAMDLGTANTIIIADGEIAVNEPSVVALDPSSDKTIAVGERAKLMYEKTSEKIRVIRPLQDGVIADFNACEQMMRGLINMVRTSRHLFTPSIRMVIGVPSGSTEVELRAVRDSAEHAGGRDVYLIYEPMAAAIGIGLDVNAPEGNMVVDIGGGTTEIAVISMGGIVSNNSIKMAGDDFTADIREYMSRQHNVSVSERMAERIKIQVGSALAELPANEAPADYVVHGPNRITALPMEVSVCYQEIAHCLERSVARIETAVLNALSNTPPELYSTWQKIPSSAWPRARAKRSKTSTTIPASCAKQTDRREKLYNLSWKKRSTNTFRHKPTALSKNWTRLFYISTNSHERIYHHLQRRSAPRSKH